MSDSLTDDRLRWAQDFTGITLIESQSADADTENGDAVDATLPPVTISPTEGAAEPGSLTSPTGGSATINVPVVSTGAQPAKHDAAQNAADAKTATAAVAGWNKRIAAITITYEVAAASAALNKAVAPFNAATEANDFTEAVKHIAAVEAALKALEAAAKAVDLPTKKKAAAVAGDKIDKMSDADIAKLKPAEKASIIKEMLGGGKPTGKLRDAQMRLYRDTDLDPAFRKVDQERQKKIADSLKGDPDLVKARANWDKADAAEIKKTLSRVVAAQCKVLGIDPPEIVTYSEAKDKHGPGTGVVEGFFDPADGKLHINVHPDSSIKDFTETIDTALHENAHNYQHQLVEQLKAGKLKEGDPLYNQALLFEANELEPGGYIDPGEGQQSYEKQPMERHSWETGAATAAKVADAIRPPAKTS
jgi:hypothetical protein